MALMIMMHFMAMIIVAKLEIDSIKPESVTTHWGWLTHIKLIREGTKETSIFKSLKDEEWTWAGWWCLIWKKIGTHGRRFEYLAVQNSSIGDLVCLSLAWSVGQTNNQSLHNTIEWPQRLVTFETFDQRHEKTLPPTCKPTHLPTFLPNYLH